jgi:MtrB/PioB family decaheme-associated outer membrane protein
MMTTDVFSFPFHRTVLAMAAIAACAACATAQAQTAAADDDKAEPAKTVETTVETTVRAGLGVIDGSSAERAQFGQYNGLRNESAVGLLDIDYSLRSLGKSAWVEFKGENLLRETRQMGLVWKNPGNWKLSADYSELVRVDPNAVNSGMLGAGSTTPQVVHLPAGPGSGRDFDLKTKRTGLGVAFSKPISRALVLDIDLKSEKKEGARLFGIGMNCPSPIAPGCGGTTGINTGWATLLVPEPVNSRHSQVDLRLSYAEEKLRFNVGYYGSFYRNGYSTLNPNVPASLNNPVGDLLPLNTGLQAILNQPVALAPDNQAHQIDLGGSYDFTAKTRGTFKFGYAKATQHDDFASAGLGGAPAGVSDLGGEVDTTFTRLGITSRPMPKLSLLADLRYEHKDDQTPIHLYNLEGTSTYTNRNLPSRKTQGKVQASWQFTSDYRGTMGANYESIDRGVFTATSAASGISALRQRTGETGVTAELRRRVSEEASGAITVSSSRRDGSNWLRDNSGLGVTEVANPADPITGFSSTAIFMPSLADRQRDKVKLFADWQPSEKLSLQFGAEAGRDKYSTPSSYGVRNTRMNQFSVDWGYVLSSAWSLNGYASRGIQTLDQSRPAGYVMAFENTNLGAGLGVTGKATSKLEVGAGLSYIDDRNVYAQTLDAFAGADSAALLAATGGLPDVVYRQTALKLFGKYALSKRSALRFDLVHQRTSLNDWAWGNNGVPFAYSDASTVTQLPHQNVTFIGITYTCQLP